MKTNAKADRQDTCCAKIDKTTYRYTASSTQLTPQFSSRACNPEDHCTREIERESWPERQCYRACRRKDHGYEANLAREILCFLCRCAMLLGMYASVCEIALDIIGTWCCAVLHMFSMGRGDGGWGCNFQRASALNIMVWTRMGRGARGWGLCRDWDYDSYIRCIRQSWRWTLLFKRW